MKPYIVIFLACCSVRTIHSMVQFEQASKRERLTQLYLQRKNSDLSLYFIEWGLDYMQEGKPDKALESFTCAAQRTTNPLVRSYAFLHIGSLYYFGNGDIKPNYAKALVHLQDPAIQQPQKRSQKVACPKAQALAWLFIGKIYMRGDETVEKDTFTAEGYFTVAAEQTDEPSVQKEAQKMLKELRELCVIL